ARAGRGGRGRRAAQPPGGRRGAAHRIAAGRRRRRAALAAGLASGAAGARGARLLALIPSAFPAAARAARTMRTLGDGEDGRDDGLDRDRLRALLAQVRSGEVEVEAALEQLAHLPFVEAGHARVDTHRALRQGLPEVVYGPGKSAEHIADVVRVQREAGLPVLVTRVDPETAAGVLARVPGGEHDAAGRLLWFGPSPVPVVGKGLVLVACAGTSDLPVAAEAAG